MSAGSSIVTIESEGNLVQNQGHLEGVSLRSSGGYTVIALGDSEITLASRKDSATDIGGSNTNSIVVASESGTMKAVISNFFYHNPDQDGNRFTSGIEGVTQIIVNRMSQLSTRGPVWGNS